MSEKDLKTHIGFDVNAGSACELPDHVIERINLQLSAMGEPICGNIDSFPALSISRNLVANFRAKNQILQDGLRPPVDVRIESFVNQFLGDVEGIEPIQLPGKTLGLIQHGMARAVSLPQDKDSFKSDIIESFRVANGVLHNPVNDRRTTKGVFHITEGGLPIPADKKAVPKIAFARLFQAALRPPEDLMLLPLTSTQEEQAKIWVSLLLRPTICPEIPGYLPEKSMEIRFFAPGSMACNLDFVESIFGNGGDPFLLENDAALDIEHWSGHTGCVILAPHLKGMTKKSLGLPKVSEASERQRRDGMCWESEDELYNEGSAFKLTTRTEEGVIVTIIADNYFGYCKKEVKTQIGYAANLYGLCEEEHAGGTLAFTSYDLGEEFELSEFINESEHTIDQVIEAYGNHLEVHPDGHATDKRYPKLVYIPEGAHFSLTDQKISWNRGGSASTIKLLAGKVYILPYGYKVQLIKPGRGRRWRLIGSVPEPVNCHKPCTVSGGGKSEISKSIADAIIHAPFYIGNLKKDFDAVDRIISRDYRKRYKDPSRDTLEGRPILGKERSLGSVIKLLTPSPKFREEHNSFVREIPTHIKELVLLVKRFYKPDWGNDWRERFSVDIINGIPGHELKYRDSKIVTSYLRVGYDDTGAWRVFSLRKDFFPAAKIQTEDDITASVVVPWKEIPSQPGKSQGGRSAKVVQNCEYRLFQRPDDAVIRGYDVQTELDMSKGMNFFSNYQPLSREEAQEIVEDAVRFDYFTDPMKDLLRNFVEHPESNPDFVVSSSNPRIVNGEPTKNPRYLQNRSTLENPLNNRVAEMGVRLKRKLGENEAVLYPVNAFLPGRRNNPPEGKIRSLAVFNPIHYLPLPEAFMEFTSSMTGKSPSTTGAGSEGALTKAPFNALLPITDLNNSLVAAALTGLRPFVTAAGYVGPQFRVDHDVSLLVPEIWSRMTEKERQPEWLIANRMLEPVPALTCDGRELPTGLLGYRINQAFVNYFLGRIFTSPELLFNEAMLKPELQGLEVFADGLDNMVTTHKSVSSNYFMDGSIERACPPMKALLHIMKDGNFEGKGLDDPEVRNLFEPETILSSDWYTERLDKKQEIDIQRWEKLSAYLEGYRRPLENQEALKETIGKSLKYSQTPEYRQLLEGTLGRDNHMSVS